MFDLNKEYPLELKINSSFKNTVTLGEMLNGTFAELIEKKGYIGNSPNLEDLRLVDVLYHLGALVVIKDHTTGKSFEMCDDGYFRDAVDDPYEGMEMQGVHANE